MNAVSPACRRWREVIRLQALDTITPEQCAGLEHHLSMCEDCLRYARELTGAAAGLRWMANSPAEPSAGFRARWTSAVEEAAEGNLFEGAFTALFEWWRGLITYNRRPLLALAPVWVLILAFRFSAPDVPPPAPATVAHSPIQIYRALRTQMQLLARRDSDPDIASPLPKSLPSPPAPRTNAFPAVPNASEPQEPNPGGTLASSSLTAGATGWMTLACAGRAHCPQRAADAVERQTRPAEDSEPYLRLPWGETGHCRPGALTRRPARSGDRAYSVACVFQQTLEPSTPVIL